MPCQTQGVCLFVRSTLEYAASVWDPHLAKDINKLANIQRRSARFVKGEMSRDRCVVVVLLRFFDSFFVDYLCNIGKKNKFVVYHRMHTIDHVTCLLPARSLQYIEVES